MEKPTILIVAPISQEYVANLNADPRIAKAQQLPQELGPVFEDMCNRDFQTTRGFSR